MSSCVLTSGQRIKRFREVVGTSQRELARVLGVTPGALAMWENETREVSGPAMLLFERLEIDFGLRADQKLDPSLTSEHLSEKFSEKFLVNIENPSATKKSKMAQPLRDAIREIIEKYASEVPGTRELQVSMVEKILDLLAGIKGVPLKIIQLASFIDFGLSPESQRLLADVQNSVLPMTTKQLRSVFMEEFGQPPEEIFSEWRPSPIASASIGQVHLAQLSDGTRVAVKVQYPNIYRKMVVQTEIFRALSLLISLARNDYSDLLRDFVKRLREECDYKNEANQQEAFYEAFRNDPQIRIPKVFRDFCSPRILTTEFIEGSSFRDFLQTARQAEKNLAGGIIHRFNYESAMGHGLLHADNHPQNYVFLKDQVAILDFGRSLRLDSTQLQNMVAFYRAVQTGDKAQVRIQMEISSYVRKWKDFDFNEFWEVLRSQLNYELSPTPTKFSRAYVRSIWRLANSFKQRHSLTMNAHFFWPIFISAGLWSLLADLEAEFPWRNNVRRSFPEISPQLQQQNEN